MSTIELSAIIERLKEYEAIQAEAAAEDVVENIGEAAEALGA